MISMLRRLAATLVAAIAIVTPASAATYSIDYTDLWYNPAESGWGVNVIQQYNILFATLFVYGPDNSARWYVASALTGSQNAYSGALYQTTGPVFSGAFNPAAVTVTQVGTMNFSFNTATTGTLTYTVNGATVTKSIQRQTFANNVYSGRYIGGMTALTSGCKSPGDNGASLIFGDLNVSQSGTAVSFVVDFFNNVGAAARCTFSGNLTAQGRLGTVSGSMSCSGAATNTGSFTMSQIDASQNGLNAVFTATDQFCNYNGRFGGVRDVL